jgi:hypothetical protein
MNYGKQRSSRPVKIQELDYTGSGTLATTNLLPQAYQVRVASDVRGYLSFGSTLPTSTSRDTATVEIFANTSEYYTTTPGQVLSFASSSTSSGSVLITEMS